MKKTMYCLLGVVVFLILLLTACVGSDGTNTVYLPYEEGDQQKYFAVADTSESNGIYIDVDNKQIYCVAGPDKIVKLPDSMKDPAQEYDISIPVEYVCMLGQSGFDTDMKLIGVTSP